MTAPGARLVVLASAFGWLVPGCGPSTLASDGTQEVKVEAASGALRNSALGLDPGAEVYAGTVTSFEMLILSIGADLRTYRHLASLPKDSVLEEMNRASIRLVRGGVSWRPSGAWILEPGRYATHPDYLYAGSKAVPTDLTCEGLSPIPQRCQLAAAPIDTIGPDVSHFLGKWPVFLHSLREAQFDNLHSREFYARLQRGIVRQIDDAVLYTETQTAPLPMLTSYMDGTNGVYRWAYDGRGATFGYYPGQLSATWYYSGLPLTDNARIRSIYRWLGQHHREALSGYRFASGFGNVIHGEVLARVSGRFRPHIPIEVTDQEDHLFRTNIVPLLRSSDAWYGSNAAAGVEGLRQVILHVAFQSNRPNWRREFGDLMQRHVISVRRSGWPGTSEYEQDHFRILSSRFLVLAEESGNAILIPDGLYTDLYNHVRQRWQGDNATVSHSGWGEPVFTNYRDWVHWKIGLSEAANRAP